MYSQSSSVPRAQTQQLAHRPPVPQSNNTLSLPVTEIIRMQQQIRGVENNSRHQDKEELHEKSNQRIKKWPNTINALRKKKDVGRFERFRVDEEERRKLDIEEAIHQAAVKKQILAKSNKQLYENNDRIRAFNSKILLTDIHQEREAQIELKALQQEMKKQRDQAYEDEMRENNKKDEDADRLKQELLLQKKNQSYQVLAEQHHQMKSKMIKRYQEDKIDGELLKMRVKGQLEVEEEAARERRQRQIENEEEVRRGNQLLKQLKDDEKCVETEKDVKIAEYSKKKDQINDMRKLREQEKLQEKLDMRQRLIDVQTANLLKIQDDRVRIVEKQIKETEEKRQREEQLKQKKLLELQGRVMQSRKIVLESKKQVQNDEQQGQVEFQGYWKQRNEDLLGQEQQELQNIRDRNMQLREFQKRQADENMKKRETIVMQDMEQQKGILRKRENEDRTFGSWAEKCIREWNENGKSVGPLIRELQSFKQN